VGRAHAVEETQGNQGLCPPEWHVPAENDWNTLFSFYIQQRVLLPALSCIPVIQALMPFSPADVSLIPGMNCRALPPFSGHHLLMAIQAWAHGMNDVDHSVSLYPSSRSNAFSVRCIKD